MNQLPSIQRVRHWVIAAEAFWYDLRHNVRTRADKAEEERSLTGDLSRGFWYRPVRPATARALLKDLPIQEHSDYIFVDFGSGKGRMLLMAADYSFRRIEGLELRKDLHDAAVDNLQRYRGSNDKFSQRRIQCLHIDATSYEFPNENMVLYFFNPFGEEIMHEILSRLDLSLAKNPRDVILVMLYPQFASPADGMVNVKRLKETGHYRVYRSCVPIGLRP